MTTSAGRRPMQPSEREFQSVVVQYAELRSWAWWHFSDVRRQGRGGQLVGDAKAAGFPDLTLVHSRFGFLFAELKSAKGKLRPAQERSLDSLSAAVLGAVPKGVLVHVWRPGDWDDVVKPVLDGTWTGGRLYGW